MLSNKVAKLEPNFVAYVCIATFTGILERYINLLRLVKRCIRLEYPLDYPGVCTESATTVYPDDVVILQPLKVHEFLLRVYCRLNPNVDIC